MIRKIEMPAILLTMSFVLGNSRTIESRLSSLKVDCCRGIHLAALGVRYPSPDIAQASKNHY